MYIFLLAFRHYNNSIMQDADNGISLIILETKLFSHRDSYNRWLYGRNDMMNCCPVSFYFSPPIRDKLYIFPTVSCSSNGRNYYPK